MLGSCSRFVLIDPTAAGIRHTLFQVSQPATSQGQEQVMSAASSHILRVLPPQRISSCTCSSSRDTENDRCTSLSSAPALDRMVERICSGKVNVQAAGDLKRLHVQNGGGRAVGPLENPGRLRVPVDGCPRALARGKRQQIAVDQNGVAAVERHRHGHGRRLVDQLPSSSTLPNAMRAFSRATSLRRGSSGHRRRTCRSDCSDL